MASPSSNKADDARLGTYPFGQPLRAVVQADRSPKRVFILGVYASAVHARWLSPAGRELVRALAVASEPAIFWDGAGAEEIVATIDVPRGAGHLQAASPVPCGCFRSLVYVRQAARLGAHDPVWSALHARWAERVAPALLEALSPR